MSGYQVCGAKFLGQNRHWALAAGGNERFKTETA